MISKLDIAITMAKKYNPTNYNNTKLSTAKPSYYIECTLHLEPGFLNNRADLDNVYLHFSDNFVNSNSLYFQKVQSSIYIYFFKSILAAHQEGKMLKIPSQ